MRRLAIGDVEMGDRFLREACRCTFRAYFVGRVARRLEPASACGRIGPSSFRLCFGGFDGHNPGAMIAASGLHAVRPARTRCGYSAGRGVVCRCSRPAGARSNEARACLVAADLRGALAVGARTASIRRELLRGRGRGEETGPRYVVLVRPGVNASGRALMETRPILLRACGSVGCPGSRLSVRSRISSNQLIHRPERSSMRSSRAWADRTGRVVRFIRTAARSAEPRRVRPLRPRSCLPGAGMPTRTRHPSGSRTSSR